MQWFLAAVAALLLAAGVVWWMDRDADQRRQRIEQQHRESVAERGPTLYRWMDANGVLNITDKPPKGRHYTVMRRDLNRVSLPHFGTSDEASDKAAKPPPH